MGQKATVKIVRSPKQTLLHMRAPFLEALFRQMSSEQCEAGGPRMGTLLQTAPTRSESPDPRISEDLTLDEGRIVIYKYYKLRNLPESAFSLQTSMDFMDHHGFLRSQGVGKGTSIKVPFPITHKMSEELVRNALENIKFLYIRYQEKYTVQGELDLGEV